MKNEFFWQIKVDGVRHEIDCRDRGNSFDVYVDGEFRFNVRSDINLDIEEDLSVGSKRCRIAVYRGVPDLIVDGILLNADAEIVRKERRDRNLTILAGVFLVGLGMLAMVLWILLKMGNTYYFGGAFAPVFAVAVTLAGVALLIWVTGKRDR